MKISELIQKIGITAAFPLLGLAALMGGLFGPLVGEIFFGFFIASLAMAIQFWIVLIWTEPKNWPR